MSIHSMRVDQLHAELYEKMEEEQRVFVEKLKEKTPDEILKSAYEYIIREDFLAEMSCSTLPERQVRAMLESSHRGSVPQVDRNGGSAYAGYRRYDQQTFR